MLAEGCHNSGQRRIRIESWETWRTKFWRANARENKKRRTNELFGFGTSPTSNNTRTVPVSETTKKTRVEEKCFGQRLSCPFESSLDLSLTFQNLLTSFGTNQQTIIISPIDTNAQQQLLSLTHPSAQQRRNNKNQKVPQHICITRELSILF